MSYVNTILDRINTIGKLDNQFKNTFETSLKIYNTEYLEDIKTLNLDDSIISSKLKIILNLCKSNYFVILNYLTNNSEVFTDFLNSSNDYLRGFIHSIDFINIDDFFKFDKEAVEYLFEADKIHIHSDSFYQEALDYCLKNNYTSLIQTKRVYNALYRLDHCVCIFSESKLARELLDYQISNNLDCLPYKQLKKAFDEKLVIDNKDISVFLEFLCNNNIEINSLKSILKSDNLVKKMDLYQSIIDKLDCEDYVKLIELMESKKFSLKEINTFVYKLNNNELSDIDYRSSEAYSEVLEAIYPNYNKVSRAFHIKNETISLIHFILKNNKKKFIELLSLFPERSLCRHKCHLEDKDVYEVINLNLLTKEQVMELNKYRNYLDYFSREYRKHGLKNISYSEFKTLLKLSVQQERLYLELINCKPDERLRIIKDIPENFESNLSMKDLASFLKEESLSNRINKEYKTISKVESNKVSKSKWLNYLTNSELDFIKPQVKTESDVIFVLNHSAELIEIGNCDFEQVKKTIFFNCNTYNKFVSTMKLTDNFIEENSESLYRFYISGLMNIFLTYYNNIGRNQAGNLVNITKAELVNKISEIKFFEGDLKKEISFDISEEKENLWKNNVKNTSSKYVAEEVYNYETIIKLGEIPVSTCMSYKGGSYNHCLLSNFDANKKILLVKNPDDTIIARAILRLTKVSDSSHINSSNDNDLAFRDIENMSGSKKVESDKTEELVLFLERCYTSSNNIAEVHNELIKLAYKKAKMMGVRLIIAESYDKSYNFIEELPTKLKSYSKSFIYVSKSKNGVQYLDSFGGSTTNDYSRYMSSNGCICLLQENMFNSKLENSYED